jgi:putative ABC transport system permease protein
MAMLLIIVLRQDLLPAWQGAVPANSPNRFVINIQNDQRNAISADLKLAGIGSAPLYPMVRGRLVDVNAKSVMPSDYKDENAKRLVDREFNLSYSDTLPMGNRVISGKWFSSDAPQISIESGIAKTLGLKLGDILSFEIAGQIVSAKITSLRKLDWSSMRVNFFVIMPPKTLQNLPQSWITSFYQPPNQPTLDLQLSQKFPNITVVDVGLSLKQIQDVIERLSAALSILFLFAIIAAILVLFAAIAATQEERFRDAALLKALGTSRGLLAQIAALELVVIGSLGGLLGGLAASAAAWALGRYVMEIEFYAFFQPLLLGLLMGLLACALAGYRFYRKIQVTTAVNCLREAM